jgi:PAS domain S-box-containing protein
VAAVTSAGPEGPGPAPHPDKVHHPPPSPFADVPADPAPCAVLDADGRVVAWSVTAREAFGHAPDAVVGRGLEQVVVPERLRSSYVAVLADCVRAAGRSPASRRLQLPAVRADGAERPLELELRASTDADGLRIEVRVHALARPEVARAPALVAPDADAVPGPLGLAERFALRAVALARSELGMDLAFLGEVTAEEEHIHVVDGAAEEFALWAGRVVGRTGSLCDRMLRGSIGSIVHDTANDPRTQGMPVLAAHRIGAFIGVPVRLPDGQLYGALCCLSHEAEPALLDRDERHLKLIARLVADQIDLARQEEERRDLTVAATAVHALVTALDVRDRYTGRHSDAVLELARGVARELGLAPQAVAHVEQAAMLHDVGKIGVPDEVLNKPGPLDELEWELMRQHPVIGAQIAASVPGLGHLAPILRAEHERWDGGGYPDGVAGDEIPLGARIVLVCDAYDAMTSDRPYRRGMAPDRAREEVRRNAGSQFDPEVARALLEVLETSSV